MGLFDRKKTSYSGCSATPDLLLPTGVKVSKTPVAWVHRTRVEVRYQATVGQKGRKRPKM